MSEVQLGHYDVKDILERWISALIENNLTVVLADDFFVKANIRIIRKDRNRPIERSLISERDTSQENFTGETTKFHFKTSFEETTSVSLATSQGFSANIGGGLSGGVGASLGLSSGLEYSRSKSFGQDKSRAQNKELTAEVDVKKHTKVTVKELTYEVQWAAVCDLELMLKKEDKIEYKCMGRWGKERYKCVEVKKLLKKLIALREKKQASSLSSALETGSRCSTIRPSLKSEMSLTGSQRVFSFIEHAESSSTPPPNDMSDQRSTNSSSSGNQVHLTENLLAIEFTSDCLFSAEEHKLEIMEVPSDPKRRERIFDHQLGEEHHEEDRLALPN